MVCVNSTIYYSNYFSKPQGAMGMCIVRSDPVWDIKEGCSEEVMFK